MAKKEREALAFVRKTKGAKDILFAVTGMPERTTAPKETAHYILFRGNKNNRYKMKINTCEFENIDGKVNRLKVVSATPNFEEVKVVASYDTQFGTMTMYQFTLDNDDICIWSTGNYIDTNEVKNGKIKFTVKDHSQFRGVKQTVVTRCKLSA